MKVRETFFDFNFTGVIQVLLLVFVVSSTNAYAQNEVIRVDTSLVTVPATVIDRNGRYVTNLKKEDFQIFEDGVEQEVALFEPTEQSFTALFLLDTSGSMKDFIADLARAANAFVSKLRPNDQLIAVTFSDQINTLFQATKIRDLQAGIKLKQRMREGDTIVYDAVDHALKNMKKVRGRKAIVLFSDGVGTGIATAKGTLRDAEEQEALIYTVQFGTFSAKPPKNASKKYYFKRIEEINGYMRDLALRTGGRYYHIEEIADLEKTFGEVAEELGRQYSLGYYPKKTPEAGQRRQIKVKMRQPNLVVRARDSYIVESPKNKQK
jgi:VWFA-related protein